MATKNIYADFSVQELTKKRDSMKGLSYVVLGAFVITIVFLIYIYFTKGLADTSLTAFFPVFILPIVGLPLVMQIKAINSELESRKKD